MKLTNIQITNFFSIEQITYNLDNPGLHLVLGSNRDNKALDSNGSGKSSMFEAIVWCLFGETLRDVPIDSVVRRGTNACRVAVEIDPEDDTFPFVVSRERRNKKTILDIRYAGGKSLFGANSVVDLQKPLNDLLGADFRTFTNSVYFDRDMTKFFMSSNDNERKALLESILQLVSFDDPFDKAKGKVKGINIEIGAIQTFTQISEALIKERAGRLADIVNKIEKENVALTNANTEYTAFLVSNSKTREENDREITKTKGKIGVLNQLKETLAKPDPKDAIFLSRVKAKYDAYEKKIRANHEDWCKTSKDIQLSGMEQLANIERDAIPTNTVIKDATEKLTEGIYALKGQINVLDARRSDKVTQMEGQKCLVCYNIVTKEHIDKIKSEIENKLTELNKELSATQMTLQDFIETVQAPHLKTLEDAREFHKNFTKTGDEMYQTVTTKFNEDLLDFTTRKQNRLFSLKEKAGSKNVKEIMDVISQISEMNSKISSFEKENIEYDNKKVNLHRLIENTETQLKSYENQASTLSESISKTESEMVDKEKANSILFKEREIAEFWVDAFGPKGIRSFIFEDAMPYITRRANYYSTFITGGTVTINISPVTTTKSTGLDKEKIFVSAKNSIGADAYAGCSSGEKTRIDLCILLALQDLISTRVTKIWNTQIYDELLDSLDNTGTDVAIDLIRKLTGHKSTYIISHNVNIKQYFDACITVVKKDSKSRLLDDSQNDS